jgi:transcriptional regulatory protein LevR
MSDENQVFQQRFDLLLGSGLANEASIAAARQALRQVEAHYGIQLSEALGAPLATHLAVTGRRLLQGERLQPADDFLWKEMQDFPAELELAARLVAGLEMQLGIKIACDEVGYLAVHLARITLAVANPSPQEPI